jgi:predicted MFS family arabinose efflux permease
VKFTGYQKFVVGLLAFLQFTLILDFMILSPLGAMLMPALGITPQQFGLVVSAYAFSAGVSGFLAAGFADRFDRKKLLLFFYSGFVLGTFLCGFAPNYPMLLLARMFTGLFGGVIGSIVFAITTDLFAFEVRGRVMGIIQTAFAGSQVLGLPLGLYLSNHWGWHAPFLMIATISVAVGAVIAVYLRPVDGHLKLHPDRKALHHLVTAFTTRRHWLPFATTALLATGGFMMMPFGSAYSVHNLGIGLDLLPVIYLVTGAFAIFTGPLMGRASDRFGKFRTFAFGSCLSVPMVVLYTHLGITPVWAVIAVSVIMWIGISARMISSQALISAIPAPQDRGAFMSVSASLQQLSGGLASALAGLIVVADAQGLLHRYDLLGFVVISTTLVSLLLMSRIHKMVPERAKTPASAPLAEAVPVTE